MTSTYCNIGHGSKTPCVTFSAESNQFLVSQRHLFIIYISYFNIHLLVAEFISSLAAAPPVAVVAAFTDVFLAFEASLASTFASLAVTDVLLGWYFSCLNFLPDFLPGFLPGPQEKVN